MLTFSLPEKSICNKAQPLTEFEWVADWQHLHRILCSVFGSSFIFGAASPQPPVAQWIMGDPR